MGSCGVTYTTLGILVPANISQTNEARKFKFGTEMDGSEYNGKKCQIMSKGVMWGSLVPLLELLDPLLYFRKRLKLETSNLAQRCMAMSTKDKMQN